MYDKYIKEREGFDLMPSEYGFVIYKIFETQYECYIKDIYVDPIYRQRKVASEMADKVSEIAREAGCTHLSGSVSLTCGDPTRSIKVLFGYGFEVVKYQDNLLWFVKSL